MEIEKSNHIVVIDLRFPTTSLIGQISIELSIQKKEEMEKKERKENSNQETEEKSRKTWV